MSPTEVTRRPGPMASDGPCSVSSCWRYLLAGALLLFPCLGACSSTPGHSLAAGKRGELWGRRPVGNVLVVGAYDDWARRITIESSLAKELRAIGVGATPSFSVFSDLAALGNRSEVTTVAARKGFDAIVVTTRIDCGERFDYEEWYTGYTLARLLGTERTVLRLTSAAEYHEYAQYVVEVGVWSADTLELIWHGTSVPYPEENPPVGIDETAEFLVGTLLEREIVSAPP